MSEPTLGIRTGRHAANAAARFLNRRPPFARTPVDRLARWLYFRAR